MPVLKKFRPLYEKKKDVVYYLFFGVLTTVVGVGTFSFFIYSLRLHELVANTFSWILAVTFAFFTNRVWVFNSPTSSTAAFFRQMLSFFGGRLFSFGVESLMIYVFISRLGYNELLVKIAANVIVLVLNYIISKFFIFSKKSTVVIEYDKASDEDVH